MMYCLFEHFEILIDVLEGGETSIWHNMMQIWFYPSWDGTGRGSTLAAAPPSMRLRHGGVFLKKLILL
jgi:hypothetical protein